MSTVIECSSARTAIEAERRPMRKVTYKTADIDGNVQRAVEGSGQAGTAQGGVAEAAAFGLWGGKWQEIISKTR